MRRLVLFALSLAMVPACLGARAETSVPGSVAVASPAPGIARQMFIFSDKVDQVAGDVIELTPSEEARPFELRGLSGATGSEDLDVWFYNSLDGNGEPCERSVTTEMTPGGGENGVMCAEARYAVVVLFQGADATFSLTY